MIPSSGPDLVCCGVDVAAPDARLDADGDADADTDGGAVKHSSMVSATGDDSDCMAVFRDVLSALPRGPSSTALACDPSACTCT